MKPNKVLSILFIDDDEATNFIHNRVIKKSGIKANVESFVDAHEVLQNLIRIKVPEVEQSTQPDIIFLDLNMPAMSGWEFLEEHEKLPENKKVKNIIIVLTVPLNSEDQRRAEKYSCIKGYEVKPLSIGRIQQIASDYLQTEI